MDPFQKAMIDLIDAVSRGRVRVVRGTRTLEPDEAVEALRSGDVTVGVNSSDMIREFPPKRQ